MYVGGYDEYTGGCSVHGRDTMSTPRGVQYTFDHTSDHTFVRLYRHA